MIALRSAQLPSSCGPPEQPQHEARVTDTLITSASSSPPDHEVTLVSRHPWEHVRSDPVSRGRVVEATSNLQRLPSNDIDRKLLPDKAVKRSERNDPVRKTLLGIPARRNDSAADDDVTEVLETTIKKVRHTKLNADHSHGASKACSSIKEDVNPRETISSKPDLPPLATRRTNRSDSPASYSPTLAKPGDSTTEQKYQQEPGDQALIQLLRSRGYLVREDKRYNRRRRNTESATSKRREEEDYCSVSKCRFSGRPCDLKCVHICFFTH